MVKIYNAEKRKRNIPNFLFVQFYLKRAGFILKLVDTIEKIGKSCKNVLFGVLYQYKKAS